MAARVHRPLIPSSSFVVGLVSCFVGLFCYGLMVRVGAQGSCAAADTPGMSSNGKLGAWGQNSLISVNIDSNSFTPAQFDCLKQVIDNFNLANGATSSGYGNFSGVCLSVTYSPNAVASLNSTAKAVNAAGISNGLQVNGTNSTSNAGSTFSGNNGTNRNSAVIQLSTNFTSCEAFQMNFAHELGHTFGLEHCNNTSNGRCADGSASIMNTVPLNASGGPDFSDTSYGLTGPSSCDLSVMSQVGQYSSFTLNQPTCGPVGGGGGDPGGGGGIICYDGVDRDAAFMGNCYDYYDVPWEDCGGGPVYGDAEFVGTTCRYGELQF